MVIFWPLWVRANLYGVAGCLLVYGYQPLWRVGVVVMSSHCG